MNRYIFPSLIAFVLIYWGPALLAPNHFDTGHFIAFALAGCMYLAWKLGQREKWLGWTYAALILGTGVNLFTNRTVLIKGVRNGALLVDFTLAPLLGLFAVGAAVCILLWASGLGPSSLSRGQSHHGPVRARGLCRVIVYIAAMSGLMSVLQWLGIRWPDIYGVDPVVAVGGPVGLWGNPGLNGITLALTLPLALWSLPWAVPPILAGLALSNSVIAFIAACVAVAYYLSWWKTFAAALVLVVALGLALEYHPKEKMSQRLRVWKATAWLYPRYPVGRFRGDKAIPISPVSATFGWGLQMFKRRFPIWDYRKFHIGLIREKGGPDKDRIKTGKDVVAVGTAWDHPHNEFISLLYEGGPVAIVPFLLFVGGFLHRLRGLKGEARAMGACLIAGLVSALWSFPFYFAPSAAILAVAAGRLTAGENKA